MKRSLPRTRSRAALAMLLGLLCAGAAPTANAPVAAKPGVAPSIGGPSAAAVPGAAAVSAGAQPAASIPAASAAIASWPAATTPVAAPAAPRRPDASAPLTVEQAIALYNGGKVAEAKHAFDTILVAHPHDGRSLYYAATINAADGHPEIAVQQVLLLRQSAPGSLAALELAVQVYQALGDRDRRDDAIDQLRAERDNALNPDPRFAVLFVRDRFKVNGHTFVGAERFDRSGETIIRYTFAEESSATNPDHLLILESDPDTNERWRELAEVPEGQLVFHLDAVDQLPDGSHRNTPFVNYVGEPGYDQVRVAVMEILTGKAKPLSGELDPYWSKISAPATGG